MATPYIRHLRTAVVVLNKRRESGTETQVAHVVGRMRFRTYVIVDDMISTGRTLRKAIRAVQAAGARPGI